MTPKDPGEEQTLSDWRFVVADARVLSASYELYEAGKVMAEAARSWHNFHHGSKDIECDEICAALPELEQAIARAEGRDSKEQS